MYFFLEGSRKTGDQLFLKLPKSPPNIKDPLPMFYPEPECAQFFFDGGMAEKSLIEWAIDSLIQPQKTFVDIGAHVGTYSWTCGRKAAHTYSFECNPKVFCYLAANIALHDMTERITPYPYALGNHEGPVNYIDRCADGGLSGVKPLFAADAQRKTIVVPMKTLDSFKLENVGLIKIDVEGSEKEVVEGATDTLRRNGYPRILFESWGDYKNAQGVEATRLREELFAYIQSLGYKIVNISGYRDMYLAEYAG